MFDTMTKSYTTLVLFFCFLYLNSNAQEQNKLKISFGGGYGYYINTFTNVSGDNLMPYQPFLSTKLYWQTEYRLRIGIRTGYSRIYSVSRVQTDDISVRLQANLDVIPIFISISMSLFKNFEATFSSGYAFMIYSIKTGRKKTSSITGSALSKYNFAVGIQYNIPIGKRFDITPSVEYLYIGKTFDNQIYTSLNLSYRIFSW